MSELYNNNENGTENNNSDNSRSGNNYSGQPDKNNTQPVVVNSVPAGEAHSGAQNGQTQNQTYQTQNHYGYQSGANGQYAGYQNPQAGYNPPYQTYAAPVKAKKKSSGRKTVVAVAVICAITVILSAFAGIGGAMLVSDNGGSGIFSGDTSGGNASGGNTTLTPSSSYTEDDNGVIYKSVSTVSESADGTATVADVAAAVKNSVVEIMTEYRSTGYFQYVTQGAGSGVIITSDGYIVTNNHVIADTDTGGLADTITVRLTDGTEYSATVVGTDSSSDIAVIKIDAANLTPAIFGDSDTLAVGEEVVAVGNPLGELGGTVTNGIISALDREIEVDGTTMNLLQTNAAINPGNSGGGLFNMAGELVGIVNAKSSGTGIEGLGFAIPSNDAIDIIGQIREYGYVRGRVYLGISFLDITDYMTATYYRVNSLGVYVYRAEEGYNDSVLQSGDRITTVDGIEVSSTSDIKNIITSHAVGDTLTFTVARDGKITDVTVTCYESIPDSTGTVNFE